MEIDGRRHIVVDLRDRVLVLEGSEDDCRRFVQSQDDGIFTIYTPETLITISRRKNIDYEQLTYHPTHVNMGVAVAEPVDKLGRRIGKRRKRSR